MDQSASGGSLSTRDAARDTSYSIVSDVTATSSSSYRGSDSAQFSAARRGSGRRFMNKTREFLCFFFIFLFFSCGREETWTRALIHATIGTLYSSPTNDVGFERRKSSATRRNTWWTATAIWQGLFGISP